MEMIIARLSMLSYGLLEPAALGGIYPLSWADGTASMFDLQGGQTKMCGKRLFAVLREDSDFEEVCIDSTVIRAHQHAAGAAKKRVSRHLAALVVGSEPKSTPVSKA